jgi:hypothetical protein
MVDLVRSDLSDDPGHDGGIDEVSVMEEQAPRWIVWVGVQMIQPSGVERTGPSDDPVDLVVLGEQ